MRKTGWIEVTTSDYYIWTAKLHLPDNDNVLSVKGRNRDETIAKLRKQIPKTLIKLKQEFAKYKSRVADRIELYERFLCDHHDELLGDNKWKTRKGSTDN